MGKHGNRLIAAGGAAAAAGTIAVAGVMTATAATHATGAPTARTETFQMMTTSGTSQDLSVIASGAFTAAGVDHQHSNSDTFAFPDGTITVKHSPGHGQQSLNRHTCLLTVNVHGTFSVGGGTGSYRGITGGGRYRLSILAVAARAGGKCGLNAPPRAYQQVIRATGPVHF
jgi:hypothetical protein